jgi:hypothetical protein
MEIHRRLTTNPCPTFHRWHPTPGARLRYDFQYRGHATLTSTDTPLPQEPAEPKPRRAPSCLRAACPLPQSASRAALTGATLWFSGGSELSRECPPSGPKNASYLRQVSYPPDVPSTLERRRHNAFKMRSSRKDGHLRGHAGKGWSHALAARSSVIGISDSRIVGRGPAWVS